MMQYLLIGKLVNTHGIKGEVRILSNFRYKDKVFVKGFKFYVGKDKEVFEVESYRKHKAFDMVVFKGYYNINEVEYLKGSLVYVNKSDLKFDKNTFLSVDLIGFNVIIDGKLIGAITEVLDTPANEVLVLSNNVMIPYVKSFINKIDVKNKKVYVNNVKGLLS